MKEEKLDHSILRVNLYKKQQGSKTSLRGNVP